MADNVAISAGTGTSIATDDVGGAHHQLVKVEWGLDGVATLVSSTNPLPVASAERVDVMSAAGVALTPKFAKANVAISQTDSVIVTAVGGKIILVLAFRLHTGSAATSVTFNSKPAGAGVAISELFALGANGGHSPGYCPVGHFKTVVSEGLTVTTTAGSTTGVAVVYVEV